jgi:predicted DNA-binding transcriptional regulator YafY
LRQAFRDFRLDRLTGLQVLAETFSARSERLTQYLQAQAARHPYHLAVVRFTARATRLVQDTKHYQGWLLSLAGQVTVVSPSVLGEHLRELAQAAQQHFCPSP